MSQREHLGCTEEAIKRLCNVARTTGLDLQNELVEAARNLAMLLRNRAACGLVTEFFNAVRETYPETRESLRRIIADILYREKKYWNKLSTEDLETLEGL